MDTPDLFLSLNLSDSEPEEAAAPPTTTATRAERTALSEEAFQSLKQTYRPKIENGEIHTTITLPIPSAPQPLPKPEAQELLHAVEELYFYRRYAEAVKFVEAVFAGGADGAGEARVDGETKRLLRYYEGRCRARLEEGGR